VYVADTANDRIVKLSASGRALATWNLDVLRGSRFTGPIGGLAIDDRGPGPSAIYVTDYGASRIWKLSASGRLARVFTTGAPGTPLSHPQGIAVDRRTGAVYVADQGNGYVQEFSSDGAFLALWPLPVIGGESAYPYGLSLDSRGNMYVSDELNDHIVKLSRSGHVVAVWGRRGSGLNELRAPGGIAVDLRTGEVYIADTGNHRLDILSATGRTMAVVRMSGRPEDVTIDTHSHVLVTDAGSHRVVVLAAR
jgi:DNA-binding beta-propeller fold protein YncE